MSPMLVSAIAGAAIAPIRAAGTRQQTDAAALADPSDEAVAAVQPVTATAARAAVALAPPAPLAPTVVSALISLQAQAERDLPGLFDSRAQQRARSFYARRRERSRAA